MLIAVMSDSHDNIWNMRRAIETLQDRKIDMVIHCGDLVAPFMLFELEKIGAPVHAVFGNNDGDRFLLTKVAASLSNITFHGLFGQMDIGGGTAAFSHYREGADGLIHSGLHKLVCFGHTHEHFSAKTDGALLLNPGEIMGLHGDPGFCIVDSAVGEFERISL